MTSEETPLLRAASGSTDIPSLKHNAVYDRFTPRRKKTIVALVAWYGLIPFFVAGTFVPSIPQIARDLNSTGPIVSLSVSLSITGAGLGNLLWASYSGFYGRRPIYLCGLPLLTFGSLAVGISRSIPQLLAWRLLQSFGVSGGLSLGAAVIGDIYKLEERGTAMGVFLAASLFGPALAPLAGGLAAHYSSWRVMQYALCFSGFVTFILMVLYFPETSHPNSRGVDKLTHNADGPGRGWKLVWLNPLDSLWLFRSPNLLATTVAGTTVLVTNYVLLIPLAYTIGIRYHITNEALIGACFLPSGLGSIIGAPFAGRFSDKIVVQWRKRRGGEWVPEDRLRATLVPAVTLVPLSVLLSGLITQFVAGKIGLILNIMCIFINGLGIDIVLTIISAYTVDVMHAQSAESMAATSAFRALFVALSVAGILPLINVIGVALTNTLSALLAWIGFMLIWVTIRFGDRMRAWIDVGYSTIDNN